MLPKNQRFSRESFPKGRPTSRRSFSWGTVALYDSIDPRFAVIVSKKAIKKAHDRNRAKRRVYALLAPLSPKTAALVHLRSEALTTPIKEIEKDLKSAFK